MDKFLRPHRLDVDPSSVHAANEWRHWFRTFENFMAAVESGGAGADGAGNALDKLVMLTNFISPMVFRYISSCSTYQLAIDQLKEVSIKPKSVIFSRHVLLSRLQSATDLHFQLGWHNQDQYYYVDMWDQRMIHWSMKWNFLKRMGIMLT